MKTNLLKSVLSLTLAFTMFSCSPDSAEGSSSNSRLIEEYSYDNDELALSDLINEHRESLGLNALQTVNHVSYKSEEHNNYMIVNNVVNHDYFAQRSQNIIEVLGAVKVNENVAYNYMTPQGALNAWLSSPGHRANIEGDFTHFGISVSINPENGRKYYTNIFVKK